MQGRSKTKQGKNGVTTQSGGIAAAAAAAMAAESKAKVGAG
jgi:hypothetical protein